ncbi:hypothetical protein ATANTOWER_019609 [Ataeniobius toweri]|uniref:Ig-like domain-containing protein n=1 Tax=Ataeniobius toweri TaxID=208326 RepID=A0ABU7CAQ0_9TELE|nr:hypothetical protein [Ataeniobius toweri]
MIMMVKKITSTINISLQILVPVSHPAMFQACLSPEQRIVNCSAEGEDTEFSFSLDNNPLIQTKAGSLKNKSVTISLSGQLTGNLHCKVQNKVSSKRTVINLTSCKDTNVLTLALTIHVIWVLPLFLAFFSCIKSFNKKRSPTTLRKVSAEVVYSDVQETRAACKLDR